MKNNFKSGIVVLVILLAVIAAVVTYEIKTPLKTSSTSQVQNYSSSSIRNQNIKNTKRTKNPYIAVLHIIGAISEETQYYNQNWILNVIDELKKDPKNKALILYINSPGGAVYQADEVYLALESYKTTGKTIYAYQGPMAASGGYYISCAANKIYANRNTLTGSIGVIFGEHYDLTGLFKNLGIKSETIHSGRNKNMLNYNEPLTEEQRRIMQSISDECYDQFVAIVAKNRNLTTNQVVKLADGRIYTASQALQNGLIDQIDDYESMLYNLRIDQLKNPELKIVDFKYERKKPSIFQLISQTSNKISKSQTASKLGLPESVLEKINSSNPFPMYMYQF